MRIWELSCPGLREEVGRARRWTRDILSDSPHADDAAVIVSELGTNALLHSASGDGAGVFRVLLVRTSEAVTVSVTDSGRTGTEPHVEMPDEEQTSGRGLVMVNALAHRVQVDGDPRCGYTVTAELGSEKANLCTRIPEPRSTAC